MLIELSHKRDIIILSDSDAAGFQIRNHIKSFTPSDKIRHAYIPRIEGKEKRKNNHSKEGIIGVEGMERAVIINALRQAGVLVDGEAQIKNEPQNLISALDLYQLGLSGKPYSSALRKQLLNYLNYSFRLSTGCLIQVLNIKFSKSDFISLFFDLFEKGIISTEEVG